MTIETTRCRRCGTIFTYERSRRERLFCDACKIINKRDSDKAASRKNYIEKVKPRRDAARRARGTSAHEQA